MRAHVFRDVTLDRARPLCQVIHKKRSEKFLKRLQKPLYFWHFWVLIRRSDSVGVNLESWCVFVVCFGARKELFTGQTRRFISRRTAVFRAHFTDQWPERPFVYGVQ